MVWSELVVIRVEIQLHNPSEVPQHVKFVELNVTLRQMPHVGHLRRCHEVHEVVEHLSSAISIFIWSPRSYERSDETDGACRTPLIR